MLEERRTSQSETNFGEVWEVALSPAAVGAELAVCPHCSGRTAQKEAGDGKNAAGISGKRRQVGGGKSTKR